MLVVSLTAGYGLFSYANDGHLGSRLDRNLTAIEETALQNAFREIPSVRSVSEVIYAPWLRVVALEVNTELGECLSPFTVDGVTISAFAIRFQPYTLIGTPHSFHYVTTCRGNRVLEGLARQSEKTLGEVAREPF